jgi:hypothetical protein
LRGNGAFTVSGPSLLKTSLPFDFPLTEENLRLACASAFEKMNHAVDEFRAQKWSVWNFEDFVKSEPQRLAPKIVETMNPHYGDHGWKISRSPDFLLFPDPESL